MRKYIILFFVYLLICLIYFIKPIQYQIQRIFINEQTVYKEAEIIPNEEIQEAYDKLPYEVKKLYKILDCELILTTEITSDYTEIEEGTIGLFSYINKTDDCSIQIDLDDSDDLTNVFYHEIGHLIDCGYNLRFESYDSEFLNIYNEEKNNLIALNKSYAISTPAEYFAECFAQYMTNPKLLKNNNPKTYDYIDNTIKNIK